MKSGDYFRCAKERGAARNVPASRPATAHHEQRPDGLPARESAKASGSWFTNVAVRSQREYLVRPSSNFQFRSVLDPPIVTPPCADYGFARCRVSLAILATSGTRYKADFAGPLSHLDDQAQLEHGQHARCILAWTSEGVPRDQRSNRNKTHTVAHATPRKRAFMFAG